MFPLPTTAPIAPPVAALPQTAAAPAAPTAPAPEPGSTADLALNCSKGLDAYQRNDPDIHIGQCAGFVDAVMQDLSERAASGDKMGICLTGNVNELDTIKTFALWANRHPEPSLALDGLRAALKEAYPCKK